VKKSTHELLSFLHPMALLLVVVTNPRGFAELLDAGARGIALLTGELRRATVEEGAAIDSWENEGGAAL
jgi:hypothetical protein